MDWLKKAASWLGNAAYQGAKFIPGVGNTLNAYEQASRAVNNAQNQAASRLQQQGRRVPQAIRTAPSPRLDYQAAMRALQALQSPRQQQILRNANPTNITKPFTGVTLVDIGKQFPSAAQQTYNTVKPAVVQGVKDFTQGYRDVATKSLNTIAPVTDLATHVLYHTPYSFDASMAKAKQGYAAGILNPKVRKIRSLNDVQGAAQDTAQATGKFAKDTAVTGLELAPYVAPFVPGTSAAGRSQMVLKQALPNIMKEGVAYGAIDIAKQLIRDGKISPEEAARAIATGTFNELIQYGGGRLNLKLKGGKAGLVDSTGNLLSPEVAKQAKLRFGNVTLPNGSTVQDAKPFTSKLIDNAVNDYQNGKISEQQLRAYLVDNFTQKYGRMPSEADISGYYKFNGEGKTLAQQAMDKALSEQRVGKVQINAQGRKVFAPQSNIQNAKIKDLGQLGDDVRFTGKQAKGAAADYIPGFAQNKITRLVSQRELDVYNKTGKLPANSDGYTNVIMPGGASQVRNVGDSKKFLVTFNDNLKIKDVANGQGSYRGGIPAKYIERIDPAVEKGPVLSGIRAHGNDVPDSVFKQDPLEALKAEARKYKSAEEFVKAQGEPLYHGTKTGTSFDSFDTNKMQRGNRGKNVYLSESPVAAKYFGGLVDGSEFNNGSVLNFYKRPGTKILKVESIPSTPSAAENVIAKAKADGYDGISFPESLLSTVEGVDIRGAFRNGKPANTTIIFSPENVMSSKQLTDIYNQATRDASMYGNGQIGNDVPKSVMEQIDNATRPKGTLNTKRLGLSAAQQQDIAARQTGIVETLSDKEVKDIARGAGIDLRSHTIEQTKMKIAQQLNVRHEIVSLEQQATKLQSEGGNPVAIGNLYKQIDELARTSAEQGTDIARQLSARRIIADETKTPMQRVFLLLNKQGVNPDVYTKKAVGVDFNDANQVVNFYRSLVPPKATEYIDLVRYNSMLSSPLTQIVNVSSTAGNISLAPVERGIASSLDFVHSLVTGQPRKFASGEGAAYAKGMVQSFPDAVKEFKASMKGLDSNINVETGVNARMPLAAPGKNKVVDVLEYPMKLMGAFDNFHRTIVAGGATEALQKRAASGIAVRNIEAQAAQEGAYRTFNQDLGDKSQGYLLRGMDEVTNTVMKLRNSKNPVVAQPAKWTLPFVRIGANLTKQGVEYSPLGLATIPGAADKTSQLAKSMMGTMVFGIAGSMLGHDRLTWAEPVNQQDKAAFRAAGMQPYSVKIGDNWVSFTKLPPIFSFNLALVAAIDDAQKNGKVNQSGVDNILDGVAKYGKFLGDQSYLKSIGDAIAAIQGDKEAMGRLIGNYPQQLVPFRALSGWIARMTDDQQRKLNTDKSYAEQQVESLFQQIPGLRQTTTTRNDANGNPIPAQHPVLNAFSPAAISTENPAGKEGYNLMLQRRQDEAQSTAELKQLKDAYARGDQSAYNSLTKQQRSSVDRSMKEDQIKKTLSPVEQQLWGYSNEELKNMQGQYRDQAQKVLALKQGLSSSGTASNPKERYQQAVDKYNQDKADGKISSVQDISRRSTLARYGVEQNFSQDTVDLYGLSKEKIDNYLKATPGSSKLFNELVALDDAMVKAGFNSKFRDKNGVVRITPKVKLSRASGGRKTKQPKPRIGRSTGVKSIARVSAGKTPKIKFAKAPSRGKTAKIRIG